MARHVALTGCKLEREGDGRDDASRFRQLPKKKDEGTSNILLGDVDNLTLYPTRSMLHYSVSYSRVKVGNAYFRISVICCVSSVTLHAKIGQSDYYGENHVLATERESSSDEKNCVDGA